MEQNSGLCWTRGGLSGGHRGNNLEHLAVLSLDGPLDGLFHLHVRLQRRGQLRSLQHIRDSRGEEVIILKTRGDSMLRSATANWE